jgi:hypothetical protein
MMKEAEEEAQSATMVRIVLEVNLPLHDVIFNATHQLVIVPMEVLMDDLR